MARKSNIAREGKRKFQVPGAESLPSLWAPRGYYRRFALCRICLRELALQGKIPGLVKSSW